MRIAVVSPRYPDSFSDNVAVTLQAMGHQVMSVGSIPTSRYYGRVGAVARALREQWFGDRPTTDERRLAKRVKAEKIQALIACTWDVHPEVLQDLGRSCARVLWWGDHAGSTGRWGVVNSHWDIVYVKDRDLCAKLLRVGVDARVMHEAANPMWHRPVAEPVDQSLAFAGNLYGFRQVLVRRLLEAGEQVRVYGPRAPRWILPSIQPAIVGEYVSGLDKSRAFGEALAVINNFCLAEGNALNCRAFEAAAAGALQLIEHRDAIRECFEPGREVLVWNTWDELLDHIARAKREPQSMRKIRQAGAARVLAEHTYQHRLVRVLQDIGEREKPRPAQVSLSHFGSSTL